MDGVYEARIAELEAQIKAKEELTRSLTLTELLESCHCLSESLSVQENKSLSTKGSTTKPTGKICPEKLQSWEEFPKLRQDAMDAIRDALQPSDDEAYRIFDNSREAINNMRKRVSQRKISSEDELRHYQTSAVENIAGDIMSELAGNPQFRHNLASGQKVTFSSHINGLGDSSDGRARLSGPVFADRICVKTTGDDSAELLFIIEYKPPHKLSKKMLRVGLQEMDMLEAVVERTIVPNNPDEKFNYMAEKVVAAAITQIYGYMVKSGLEYGCIMTGEAMVFLRIDEAKPRTIYFHLAEPVEEVKNSPANGFPHSLTMIGQLCSFCSLALSSNQRDQTWINKSVKDACRWDVDEENILQSLSPDILKSSAPPSAYRPRTYRIADRSPCLTRGTKRRKRQADYDIADVQALSKRNHDDSSDGSEHSPTPHRRGAVRQILPNRQQTNMRGGKEAQGSQNSASGGSSSRVYCTQKCLLGLVRGMALDSNCPNFELHQQGTDSQKHLITRTQFPTMVQQQLKSSLDLNIKYLWKQGARGMLFQIFLVSHGYTFVAKGTTEWLKSYLLHEGQIYNRLKWIQGELVPVYLGNIDLAWPWRDMFGTPIIHMLLMSWGGECLTDDSLKDHQLQVQKLEAKFTSLGVCHEDIRSANLLWNEELRRVIAIDFERSIIIQRANSPEAKQLGRKRKRSIEGTEEIAEKRALGSFSPWKRANTSAIDDTTGREATV